MLGNAIVSSRILTISVLVLTFSAIFLPSIALVHANIAPSPGNPGAQWLPAGPSMDSLSISVYSSASAELTAFYPGGCTSGQGDLPDAALTVALAAGLSGCPNYLVTTGATKYAYPSGWINVVDSTIIATPGPSNFFSALNMWNPTPAVTGTIRWGFSASVTSMNPYTFPISPIQNFYVVREIYDSLYVPNPYSVGQVLDWMTLSSLRTGNTVHNILRGDIYWQDGSRVTAGDVAFSYNTLSASPIYAALGLSSITLVTFVSQSQVDIKDPGVAATSARLRLGSLPILPGRYWSSCGVLGSNTWDAAVSNNFGGTYASCLISTAPGVQDPNFDPIASGILIGSGPFVCQSTFASVVLEQAVLRMPMDPGLE